MARLEHLMIHCTDTPPDMLVTPDMIKQWHMGPRDVKDKNGNLIKVRYLSQDFRNRDELPDHKINGIPVRKLNGRGWDRVGYADMIRRDGSLINLTPYDSDDWIDSNELTYGALKMNRSTRHVVLVGGWLSRGVKHGMFEFDEIYTDAQFIALQKYIKEQLGHHSHLKVLGHYQVQDKTCPNFYVPVFLDLIVIPKENYYVEA